MGLTVLNLARADVYFLVAVTFDVLRNLGYAWAAYGIIMSLYAIFSTVGILASSMYFCPDCRSFRESINLLRKRASFLLYEAVLLFWVILYLVAPQLYVIGTLVLLGAVIVYPTTLFRYSQRRAKPPTIKNMLNILSGGWFVFVMVALLLFALGTQPPVLGVSVPYAYQIAFVTSSSLFFLMSIAVADPIGTTKFWAGQLVPGTIIKPGHRYLILHDSGRRTVSFFSSTLKNLIESGARVIMNSSKNDWLSRSLSQSDPHFSTWIKSGKIVLSDSKDNEASSREGLSERFSLAPIETIFVNELSGQDLQRIIAPIERDPREKHQSLALAQLFLLESAKAPRPQLIEFLRRNADIEFLNLSESTDPFSSLVNLEHEKIHGSSILLEYDTNSDYETMVDKFLAEGISNAEVCVLFTTKSSKLYRAIKGKRMIKIVAASSLISVPDELPDGEMQIPDKELGLVASIASDFLENSKSMGVSFVFDSITELIRGDRWEQVYLGIKQLIDLLSAPNVTSLFLANRNTLEPRFLGALHGAFSTQIKLDNTSIKAVKVSSE